VIYVSDGFPLTADSEPIGFPEKLTSGDLRRAFGEMIRAANSVNARVYIFWPPGLIGLPFSTPPPDSDEWRRYVSDSTAMLAELAKRTGGMTVMSAGSLVDATKALLAR
jgi:hypothetical protein